MDDLVQFVRDRLDEDEAVARAAAGQRGGATWHTREPDGDSTWVHGQYAPDDPEGWRSPPVIVGPDEPETAHHIARHDPARVLAEVEAKRRICRDYENAVCSLAAAGPGTPPHDLMTGATNMLKRTLQLLALPRADHPDYREEWRP
jgi:hypothetical protein